MMQIEAVQQMVQPGFAAIAAKGHHKSNPWFGRGTLFQSAVDLLQRAEAPMTAREIVDALIAEDPSGDSEASHRPGGRYPCRSPEAQRRQGDWRQQRLAFGEIKEAAY
jgi:hypothetical protein